MRALKYQVRCPSIFAKFCFSKDFCIFGILFILFFCAFKKNNKNNKPKISKQNKNLLLKCAD